MSFLNSIANIFRFNRKNWRAVTLCILCAAVFWVFNALNKNYTTNLSFPLEFEFNRENYVAVRPLPSSVRINVTGIGWDLFRRSLGIKLPPLIIPLERPAEIRKIVASPTLFVNQLERFEINFVLTDTLSLAIEPKGKRWMRLKLDTPSLLFRKDYIRTSVPEIEPDSIYIEGPLKLINSLQDPINLKISQRNIDEDFDEDIEVRFLNNELISRDPPTVTVKFKVDRLVEVSDSVRLDIINYPKNAKPYFGIKALPCTFAIPERFLNQYEPDSVEAIIDLKSFTGGTEKLLPEIHGLPPYSRVIKIDSIFVRF